MRFPRASTVLASALLIVLTSILWYLFRLPDTTVLRSVNPDTWAIQRHREEQARQAGKKMRSRSSWRRLNEISPHLVNAVVIAEDDGFYRHKGFDLQQIRNAARTNWERKRLAFGGSTITQQLARSLYLSSHKNFLRKAKEALITRRLEATLSKKRILELYLNVVEWGPGIYGAEAASLHHFGKSASELTPEEAVALAAILPSPRRWSPTKESRFMVQRRKVLYQRMVRAGHIVTPTPIPSASPGPGEFETPSPQDDAEFTDEEVSQGLP